MNAIDLNNRHAVVTGGAQGLGFAVAQRLLISGASVSLWDMDATMLTDAAEQLSTLGNVLVETVDVSDHEDVTNATASTIAKTGKIDILSRECRDKRAPTTIARSIRLICGSTSSTSIYWASTSAVALLCLTC